MWREFVWSNCEKIGPTQLEAWHARRWPMVHFQNMLDITALNVCTIFAVTNPTWCDVINVLADVTGLSSWLKNSAVVTWWNDYKTQVESTLASKMLWKSLPVLLMFLETFLQLQELLAAVKCTRQVEKVQETRKKIRKCVSSAKSWCVHLILLIVLSVVTVLSNFVTFVFLVWCL